MLNFINTGLDEATLESVKPYTQDNDLIKAMNKQGLVQREVTVQGKGGTFTRKQWVRASEEQTNTRQAAKQDEPAGKQTDKQDDEKSSWKSKIDSGNFTDDQKQVLQSGLARDHAAVVEKDGKILTSKDWDESKYAESNGWKRVGSLTEVINRGSVSVDKTTEKGASDKQSEPSTDSKQFIDLNEFLSGKTLNGKTPKACIVSFLNSGVSRSHLMSSAKVAGITWKENANEGINWMRASMAIQKHVSEASSAPAQTPAQTDSKEDSSKVQATKSDTTDTTTDFAKELGVNASSMSAWDDKTLTSLRDTFNQSIVNMIQARDTAKRQAEMYYKSGNDTLRKQCEEMSATYDKQADKYISAMLVVTKEIISRQNSSGNTSTTQSN